MNYRKIVHINKKVKFKSLKQIVDICIDKKWEVDIDCKGNLSATTEDWTFININKRQFGKELTIKSASLEFNLNDKQSLDSIDYYAANIEFNSEFSVFFTKFPKLSKSDKEPPVFPPEPKVVRCLPEGDGHSYLPMNMLDNGTLEVGCNKFSKKQLKNIRKFLED